MPNYDHIRRAALRSIKGGKTKYGAVHYGPGAALRVPVKTALLRLVELHKHAIGETTLSAHISSLPAWAAQILHRRETCGFLGTLLGVHKQARQSLERSVFEFAEKHRSLNGIESVVLSANCGVVHENPRVAEQWRRMLREMRAPRMLGGGYQASPVLDPITREFTFFHSEALSQYLDGGAGDSQRIPLPDPGVAEDDPSTCVRVITVVSAVVGTAGGVALGGLAGASVDNGNNKSAIILGGIGGGIAGFFGGAQGGQSFGQAVCPGSPPGTPAPSGPGSSTTPAPGDLPQGQWEDNLISSTPDATSDPAAQKDYSSGFDAGWAAATSGAGAGGGSDSFYAGYADGYGAAQAMQTLPAGGNSGGGSNPGDGNPGSGNPGEGTPNPGDGNPGEGTPNPGDGNPDPGDGKPTASDGSDDGDVGDGPVSPGTGAIFHHFNPSGPGIEGFVSDDGGDGDLDTPAQHSPVRSSGARVVRLVNPPDPDNNPRALHEVGAATLAQAALLSATIAERLSGIAGM